MRDRRGGTAMHRPAGSHRHRTSVRGRTTRSASPTLPLKTCIGYQATSTTSARTARTAAANTLRSREKLPRASDGHPVATHASATIQTPPQPGRSRWSGSQDSRPNRGPASLTATAAARIRMTEQRAQGEGSVRPSRPTEAPPQRIKIVCSAAESSADARQRPGPRRQPPTTQPVAQPRVHRRPGATIRG